MRPLTTAKRKAFTLVELIVVIVILGILASVATVGYNSVISRSSTEAARAEANSVDREVRALLAYSANGTITQTDITDAVSAAQTDAETAGVTNFLHNENDANDPTDDEITFTASNGALVVIQLSGSATAPSSISVDGSTASAAGSPPPVPGCYGDYDGWILTGDDCETPALDSGLTCIGGDLDVVAAGYIYINGGAVSSTTCIGDLVEITSDQDIVGFVTNYDLGTLHAGGCDLPSGNQYLTTSGSWGGYPNCYALTWLPGYEIWHIYTYLAVPTGYGWGCFNDSAGYDVLVPDHVGITTYSGGPCARWACANTYAAVTAYSCGVGTLVGQICVGYNAVTSA